MSRPVLPLQPTAAASSGVDVSNVAGEVAAADTNRIGVDVANPATNTLTMYFRWGSAPVIATKAYDFLLLPGQQASCRASLGDPTQLQLQGVASAAGPEAVAVTLMT